MSQLALPLQLADHAVFASFLPKGNEELTAALIAVANSSSGSGCWIWGGGASGKTHLLQAVCERAGDRSVYVPLAMLAGAGPGLIDGLDSRELVCIDDLHEVVGDPAWERALFTLYNDLLASGGQLFGFFGILLALPAAAVLSVLIRFAYNRYLKEQP